jgi:hypothetical protein
VRQLHPDPNLGPLKHDHKLTLIFFSLIGAGLEGPWIKRGDPAVIWPRDWLPKEKEGLGDNILVLSVQCYIHPKTELSVRLQRMLVRELLMKYVCSHLNALLGSFLGVRLECPLVISSCSLFAFQCMFYFTLSSSRAILQSCYLLQKMI